MNILSPINLVVMYVTARGDGCHCTGNVIVL